MENLFSLLLFAGLFFVMMQFGCGSHKTQGHGGARRHTEIDDKTDNSQKHVDPVCGMVVDVDKGYGMMYQGRLYRFCHRSCMDKFESDPNLYLKSDSGIARIQGGDL